MERSSNELNRLLGEYETAIEFLAKDNRAQSSLTGAKVKPLDRGAQLSSIMEIRLVPVLAEYSALTSIEPEEWISLRDSEGRLVKTEQELRNLIALRVCVTSGLTKLVLTHVPTTPGFA